MREHGLKHDSTGCVSWEIRAITRRRAEFMNCELITGQVTGSISPSPDAVLFCCCAAVINTLKPPTSNAHGAIGRITSRGINNENVGRSIA